MNQPPPFDPGHAKQSFRAPRNPRNPDNPKPPRQPVKPAVLLSLLLLFTALIAFIFVWGFCRVYVPAGHMAIITAKTGAAPAPGALVVERGQKGIWREPLAEGRYFFNPITYDWKILPALSVPVGKVAVITAKTGAELPPGQILAANPGDKGVWKNVLGPGTYRLNPQAFEHTLLDAVAIPVGYVGIVTSQVGEPVPAGQFAGPGQQGVMADVLHPGLYYVNPKAHQVDVIEVGMNQVSIIGRAGSVVSTKSQNVTANTAVDNLALNTFNSQQERRANYIEENRDRGFVGNEAVQQKAVSAAMPKFKSDPARRSAAPAALMAGTRFEKDIADATLMEGTGDSTARARFPNPRLPGSIVPESAAFALERFIEFPSLDGFQILLDMTVEFELLPENIARVYMLYGDLPAVVEKIILPQILSIARLKGSSYKAREFIDGEGRQVFQKEINDELIRVLRERHILAHNVIISKVEIPAEILTPIQTASKAKEQDLTNQARQDTARKQAELNTQLALIEQGRSQVEQETQKIVATIAAQTRNEVASIAADADREAALINLEKAAVDAQITQTRGYAKVEAERLVNAEAAKGFQMKAAVFQNPTHLAQLQFIENINPEIKINILHSGEGTLWTDMKALSPVVK